MICKKCGSLMSRNGFRYRSDCKVQGYKCKECKHEQIDDEPVGQVTSSPEFKPVGLNEEQFRAKFDLRFIVEAKCKILQRGIFLSMSEFVKFCGITPSAGYRDVMLHSDFDAFRGKVRGEIYWSAPESITKLRSEGILN